MNPHFESRDLSLLSPEFEQVAKEVIQKCAARGVVMVPFFTLRGPGVQAKLFCQSRKIAEIEAEARKLRRDGAHWLSSLMRTDYGTDHLKRDPKLSKRWATDAPPGASWHQHGLAIDCYVRAADGTAIWDGDHFGYAVYEQEAKKAGATSGRQWGSRDAVHIQHPKAASPTLVAMTWPQIEEQMILKFKEKK
jgi:peptidoglycan L-alanyl-D-glutamate endopeptidase CwlK